MAGQQGRFQAPPRPKNALDEFKLRLSCPPVQGATKPGSWAISLVANNPRIDVYTNVPNDKNNGNIRGAMDMPTFYLLIEMMRKAITLDDNQVLKLQNLNHVFFGGERSAEPKLISTTLVGRDKDGVLFLACVAKDRPYLKFNMLPTNYHVMIDVNGEPMNKREASNYFLAGYANMLENMMAAVAVVNYTEPKPKDNNGGGNNYNRGGNGGGGGNNYNRNNNGGGGGGGQRNNDWGGDGAGTGGGADSFGDDDFPM